MIQISKVARVLFLGLLFVAATEPAKPLKSLYERLGKEQAIEAVAHDFVARGLVNPQVNFTRQGTPHPWPATPVSMDRLIRRLIQFLCVVTGGPQTYEGKDMKTAHAGMRITNAEFDALVSDLRASLDKFNVPRREQKELLTLIESTRGGVVEEIAS